MNVVDPFYPQRVLEYIETINEAGKSNKITAEALDFAWYNGKLETYWNDIENNLIKVSSAKWYKQEKVYKEWKAKP